MGAYFHLVIVVIKSTLAKLMKIYIDIFKWNTLTTV